MASTMEIDDDDNDLPTSSSGKGEKKRFEVKKVSEVIQMNCWKTNYIDSFVALAIGLILTTFILRHSITLVFMCLDYTISN